MKSRRIFLALAAAGAVARPAVAQSPPTLRVALTTGDDGTPVLYAQRAGLYAKAGLAVELTQATSGAAISAAVIAGTYEVGKSSLVSLLNAHLHGVPVAIVAGAGIFDVKAPYAQLVVAADAPYRNARDLNGKLIGVPSLNDLNQLVAMAWADQNGGDSKTLRFVELSNPASFAALPEHRIDAAVMVYPFLAEATVSGKIRVLGSPYAALADDFLITVWFASSEWAVKHPDLIHTFVRVTSEAAAYTNAHHAETAPMIADWTKIPLATVERMTRVNGATVLRTAEIQPVIDAAVRYKLIPRGFAAAEMLLGDQAAK